MASINAQDISETNDYVTSESDELKGFLDEVQKTFDEFRNESSQVLYGPGFDMIRTSLGLHSLDVKEIMRSLDEELDNLEIANQLMLNYLDGVSYITDEFKIEIERQLELMRKKIKALKLLLIEKDEEGNPIYDHGYINGLINQAEKVYKELKEIKKIIDGLEVRDDEIANQYLNHYRYYSRRGGVLRRITHMTKPDFTFQRMYLYTGIYRNIDSLSSNALDLVFEMMPSLIRNGSPTRIDLVLDSLTYLDKGIRYSQGRKRNLTDENGFPIYLDCSSFISRVYRDVIPHIEEEGITQAAWTGTFRRSDVFSQIDFDELLPGDLLLTCGQGRHIGMYIGQDENNNVVYIDMGSGTYNEAISVPRCRYYPFQYAIRYDNMDLLPIEEEIEE